MSLFVAKLIWFLGVAGWFTIRYPHYRRSRKTPRAQRPDRTRELVLLTISFSGMFIVPAIYALTDVPKFATYPLQPALTILGTIMFGGALWMFHRTHEDLGRNWSVTLEVRVGHSLVTEGVYRRVRHPMYTAFFMWAIAQALLLPNWVAGFAGLAGFGTLFAFRVGREERMMLETFGDQYRQYAARTKRIIPGVF